MYLKNNKLIKITCRHTANNVDNSLKTASSDQSCKRRCIVINDNNIIILLIHDRRVYVRVVNVNDETKNDSVGVRINNNIKKKK